MTALFALGVALFVVYQENIKLSEDKERLLALSSRLIIEDPDKLEMTQYPRVADDFASWEVYIPSNDDYELRFGTGELSQGSMPEEFERIPLLPGRHRITLRSADSADENYHFTVFVDGESVIDQTLGESWMPNGWRQASGLSVPIASRGQRIDIHQLKARIYTPRVDYGKRVYFNGQSDDWVSNPGYRLWIDQSDQRYEPASPFLGLKHQPQYMGIGLRNGLRYRSRRNGQYQWNILRPASQTNDPVLTIIPEFQAGDKIVLTDGNQMFQTWKLRNAPTGKDALAWEHMPNKVSYSAFLHADVDGENSVQPVVELRWDVNRPDDVGLRLPKVSANASLTNWRLRIVGDEHLWRLLDIGSKQLDARKHFDGNEKSSRGNPFAIDLKNPSADRYRLQWRTNIAKPLQMLERGVKAVAAFQGVGLFRGLPLSFEADLPAASTTGVRVTQTNKLPGNQAIVIPGGPVFDEIQLELDATSEEWVWLRVIDR